ncbi:type IV pilin [Halorussus caseinilyticus]|uniref:Type IV pilin n=1 Tax=Halorussus caseinilyticus TaxID=3034025 RepID=A0ABD5WFL4_9EURY|nr:type IV pilin [Halorussus sp. DT72]
MNVRRFFEDDGAVSPAVSVVLMVAVTVVLATTIGTFVLGFEDRVSEPQPNAQFAFEYREDAMDADGDHGRVDEAVNITHDGGQAVEATQLRVTIDGVVAYENGRINESGPSKPYPQHFTGSNEGWTGEITADDRIVITENEETVYDSIRDGDVVRVVWTAPGSDDTAVVGESEVSL